MRRDLAFNEKTSMTLRLSFFKNASWRRRRASGISKMGKTSFLSCQGCLMEIDFNAGARAMMTSGEYSCLCRVYPAF